MSATILSDHGTVDVAEAEAAGGGLWLPIERLQTAIGWTLKPEGLCRGPVCVPVPHGRHEMLVRDGRTDVAGWWRLQDKPVAASDDTGVWVLGEAAEDRAGALASLAAPDFELPDLDGRLHRLSAYRGRKVLLATWASW